eukprot:2899304-Lingulodinium_polyedra.AAC.1
MGSFLLMCRRARRLMRAMARKMFLRATALPSSSSFNASPRRKLMSASTPSSLAWMPAVPMKAWNHPPFCNSMENVRAKWP